VGWFIIKREGDPGSTQEHGEHGWFTVSTAPPGSFGDIGHFTPTANDKQMAGAMKLLASRGVTDAQVQANLKDMYANGQAKGQDSHEWYAAEHEATMMWVDHGYSDIQAAGMLAATTANVSWSKTFAGDTPNFAAGTTIYSNLTAAATCAAYVTDNPTLTITQEQADLINGAGAKGATSPTYGGQPMDGNSDPPYAPLQAGQVPAQALSDYQLGKWASMSGNSMIPGVPIGYPDSVMRGIEIARGADPTEVLQGYKEQSFMNNVAFPNEASTATIDSHMSQGMLPGGGTTLQGDAAKNWDGQGFPIVQQFDANGDPRVDGKGNNVYKDYARDFVGTPAGYTYCANMVIAAANTAGMVPNQYQAVAWAGVVTDEKSLKNSKLDIAKSFVGAPFINDDVYTDDEIAQFDADMNACGPFDTSFIAAHTVTSLNFKTPGPDDAVSAFADTPKWFKGFGDPGSTQQQDAHGRFTAGSGNSNLEAKAIAHFGAAEELQGQQFITPNGTILNLEGDGHDRIKEVVGGNVATATSRALDAGFLRTSLDTVKGGDLGLVMELTTPMTSQQIASVRQGISDAGGIGYIAVDVANTGGYNRVTGAGGGLLYSQDQEQPTSTQIATIIRDANVAAGAPVNAAAFAELLKGFGDPGSTQEREPGGTFGPGSGAREHAPRLRDITIGSAADTGELAMRSTPITAPHVPDPLAAQYAADLQFTTQSRGTNEGDSLTEGFPTAEEAAAQADAIIAARAAKGFGDPGSTQQQDAHGRFTVGSGAPRDAANLKYPELRMSDMTAGATNSPSMTRQEFQASAARGEDIVNSAIANGSPHSDMMTPANVQAVVSASQQEWGGVTIDAHGGGIVAAHGDDPLSVSMRDAGQGSVTIPITSDPATLTTAMQQAQSQFADQLSAQGAALGMFRDEKAGTVQFDPVIVVQGVSTARDVGAYTGATGGAYRFSDGNGYWPGHVA
jgi:hypothetical protein